MDGTRKGFDIDLATEVVNALNIPVVVASGAGSLNDIQKLIKNAKPSGVALASILHYDQVTIQGVKNCINSDLDL